MTTLRDALVEIHSLLGRCGIRHAQPVPLFGHTIPVVNATDLIVLKLRAGGPQDLYDVAGVLAVSGHYLDLADIERLAARIGVLDKWALAQGLAREALPTQPPPVADQPDKPPHLPPQNGS